MNETTRTKALAALDGMREIVRREMLVRGAYVDDKVSNPRLVGAICGGRKHCAIGSLWAGAGVKPKTGSWDSHLYLPGTGDNERSDFLRRRHGLRAAYNALNDAASAFADKHELDLDESSSYYAPVEALFEGYYGESLTKRDLLKIIASAKRSVKGAA